MQGAFFSRVNCVSTCTFSLSYAFSLPNFAIGSSNCSRAYESWSCLPHGEQCVSEPRHPSGLHSEAQPVASELLARPSI